MIDKSRLYVYSGFKFALGNTTCLAAVLDSNTFARSSILGALKPDETDALIVVFFCGVNIKPKFPVTAILFCFTAVSGKVKNELSKTLLFKLIACKRRPSFNTNFLFANL